jgi:flagellar M-ring protein FliF
MAAALPANAPGATSFLDAPEDPPASPINKLTTLLQSLGPIRLLGLVAALGAVLVSLIFLIIRLATPDYEILFSKLSPEDSAAIVRQLEASREPYRLGDGGGTILVDRANIARLRINAAEQKLPSRGSVGYELFDKVDSLSATSSLFQVTQVRALEGELARTITQIAGVEAARVHLVIPFRELFSQQTPETRASVVLQLKPNSDIGKRRVEAVRQLVASAVKNLSPARVSIVDTQGNLLARGDGEASLGASSTLVEQKLDQERRLRMGIERLVEQYVGIGKVRADVTVDLTLAAVVRTSEMFDPKSRVERSVQTVEEAANRNETRSDQDVSVQQNLPESRTNQGATRNQENTRRAEETTNFEVSKTSVRETIEPGTVRRISVAVLVDGTREPKADGTSQYKPRSTEEMQALEKIVRSAVGFSTERNDVVEVVNLPFAPPEIPDIREPGPFDFTKSDILTALEALALLTGVLLLVLLVLRPALKSMIEPPEPAEEVGLIVDDGAGKPPALTAAVDDVAAMKAEIEREMQELQAKRAESLAEMIDIDKIEGQVQASAVKRITEIVDKHPEEAAQVIRSWLSQAN